MGPNGTLSGFSQICKEIYHKYKIVLQKVGQGGTHCNPTLKAEDPKLELSLGNLETSGLKIKNKIK